MTDQTNERTRPNCYKCKYRGKVPGSVHSCCEHPDTGLEGAHPVEKMMALFASVGRVSPVIGGTDKLNVKGNPHGIANGWFNFPFNFDPVWLLNCDGFEAKEG